MPHDESLPHHPGHDARQEMQYGRYAFHDENVALYGDETNENVHGEIHGTFLLALRHENGRLLLPQLHLDLQRPLHDHDDARKQHDGLFDQNGRIFDVHVHGCRLVRTNETILRLRWRLLDENDERLQR